MKNRAQIVAHTVIAKLFLFFLSDRELFEKRTDRKRSGKYTKVDIL